MAYLKTKDIDKNTVDALAGQFKALKSEARKSAALGADITLKLGKVAYTARQVLKADDRLAFREAAGLSKDSYASFVCIGRNYEWLKPYTKYLPSAPSILVRIAQRLDADSLPKYIESGDVDSLTGIKARHLPVKFPKKAEALRRRQRAAKRHDLFVTVQLDEFELLSTRRFLVHLLNFLKDEQIAWGAINPAFELSPDLKKALRQGAETQAA